MSTRLYLDTARLGRMSPSAQRLQVDFARWAGEEAASLYFDAFLTAGTRQWPASMRSRFPALDAWRGVAQLQQQLKRFVGAPSRGQVFLAGRSAQLMKLAARLLVQQCRTVFITDLTWPSYQQILAGVCRRSGTRLVSLPIRNAILNRQIEPAELMDRIVTCLVRHRCDGLFLPEVDNLGIHLPVAQLVSRARRQAELRFVVVDGAQAFGHLPIRLAQPYCDLWITGCHKWLGAYHPLGVAFCGRQQSTRQIKDAARRLLARGGLDDPLMRLLGELQRKMLSRYGETVNLVPLFTCQGALRDALRRSPDKVFSTQLAGADRLASEFVKSGWCPLRPAPALRTGILLLQLQDRNVRAVCPDVLRQRFHQVGLAVSTYPRGIVRVSTPGGRWPQQAFDHVVRGFRHIACSLTRLPRCKACPGRS